MPTVGSEQDHFDLMGRKIQLRKGRLTCADGTLAGTLAGAHLDMASAVRNAVTLCGIALEDALVAASLTPARFLGIEKERGAIVSGAFADLVALDRDLRLVTRWAEGEEESDLLYPDLGRAAY